MSNNQTYKVIGIDEAGKGPVLGSMFIGFSIINLAKLDDLNDYQELLKNIGVDDSKKISAKKRNAIYQSLKNNMDMKYVQLTPANIDKNNAEGGNLLELEVLGMIEILNAEEPDLVIVDAPTAKPDKFGEDLLKRLKFDCRIISENKADSKYTVVGAASIIAKELREQEVEQIKINVAKLLEGKSDVIEPGSGYPTDPNTKVFLKEHYENKEFDFIFRKSWQTYKNLAGDPKQKTLGDF